MNFGLLIILVMSRGAFRRFEFFDVESITENLSAKLVLYFSF
jgi:hypothetical protein